MSRVIFTRLFFFSFFDGKYLLSIEKASRRRRFLVFRVLLLVFVLK
jgi:hypothetical protein